MPVTARVRLALAVLLGVTLLAYLPALRNDFVWDDVQYIVENPRVAGGLTTGNVVWALTAFKAGNWHPLTWVSHMLDVEVAGLGPWWPHLVNILLHLANTVLVFLFLSRLTGAVWSSLLVSALFALHPLHVESVAWAAERKDLLSTLFGLLAAGAFARHARHPGGGRYLATLVLFAAALAAKPMLVTLPCLLLLIDWWPLGRLRTTAWRGAASEKIPLLALSAGSSTVAWLAQSGGGALGSFALDARLSNAAVSYCRYLGKAVAPFGLGAMYPHPLRPWPAPQTAAAFLLLGLATATVLRSRRRSPWLAVGWFWFLGVLVPVIGLIQVGQQALADRYTYLPATGLFVALVWSAATLGERRPGWRPALLSAGAAGLLFLAALTAAQVGTWKDTETLFTRAARVAPGNWVAHFNLGEHYQKLGRHDEAVAQYRAAIAARPDYEKALNNLAVILAVRGSSAEAEGLYRAAILAQPDYEKPYNNLGAEYVRQGRLREAEALYGLALEKKPEALEPRLNLGSLLLKEGRLAEAEARFSEARRVDPGSAQANNGLGIALARQGRFADAAAAFQEAQRLAPADRDIAANLEKARSLAAK